MLCVQARNSVKQDKRNACINSQGIIPNNKGGVVRRKQSSRAAYNRGIDEGREHLEISKEGDKAAVIKSTARDEWLRWLRRVSCESMKWMRVILALFRIGDD